MHLRLNPTRVEVKAEMSSRMPDFVISDRARSRQILLNLPGNAVKFTSDGLIAMMVDYSTEGELIFKVKDRGIGIAAADQERLFIPLS
jgi:two-component system sensor histidine kinase/response regulator